MKASFFLSRNSRSHIVLYIAKFKQGEVILNSSPLHYEFLVVHWIGEGKKSKRRSLQDRGRIPSETDFTLCKSTLHFCRRQNA